MMSHLRETGADDADPQTCPSLCAHLAVCLTMMALTYRPTLWTPTGKVSKIGLWGRSMGAATSLFYGQKDPSVAALVLDSPFGRDAPKPRLRNTLSLSAEP